MAFIYDLTDTWNAGGTTFNAIKMNVTDSASAAASKLVTLQVGGAERFGVDKAGIGTFASVVRAAGGSTGAPAFSFGSDTNTGMWSPSSDAIAFSTAGSERLRVDSLGNVGVGTTSPSSFGRFAAVSASVNGTAISAVSSSTGATDYAKISFFHPGNDIFTLEGGAVGLIFKQSGTTERMRIDGLGRVGIGTSSPAERLEVAGNLKITGSNLSIAPSTGTSAAYVLNTNTSGNFFCAIDGNTGAAFGAGNYARVLYSSGAYPLAFFTNDTERMRIDSSGNIGIGTSSPTGCRLQIKGANNLVAAYADGLKVTSNNESVSCEYNWTGINASSNLLLATAGSERMRIDSSGNLLVGTTSTPENATTNAAGHLFNASNYAVHAANNTICLLLNRTGTDGQIAQFRKGGTIVGGISVTTTATTYLTSSDYRLKDIDGPIANSGAYIDALKPVQGSWKADGSRFIGLLAHEAQEASETQIATGEKDGEEMQAMDYSSPEIIANLIAELQSVRARLAQLEGN